MPSIIPPPPPRPSTATLTSRIWLEDADYTVASDVTMFADGLGIMIEAYNGWPDLDFTNHGTLWSRASDRPAILGSSSFGMIVNTGLAVAEAIGNAQVTVFGIGSHFGGLNNSGSIYALANGGSALAVVDYGGMVGGVITNSGLIAAQSLGQVYAVVRFNGGAVHNLAGGSILAEGAWGQALRFDRGLPMNSVSTVAVWNEGLIEAVSTDPTAISFAIGAIHGTGEAFDIFNSGTIRADYAIYISAPDPSLGWQHAETVTNTANGLLDGGVYLGGGNDCVINDGLITGLVELGAGDDDYQGASSVGDAKVDGGDGADLIRGGRGDDVLTGGAGTDVLTGGAGNDTFRDSASNLSGDTITDFGAGDRIVITNANLAGFTFSLAGNVLTFTGGLLTLTNVSGGTFVASAAAGGGVELSLTAISSGVAHAGDFNGDGRSDVLWRDAGGRVTDWLGQGAGGFTPNFANADHGAGNQWQVFGTGDFNHDSRDDILWRNVVTGEVTDWLAQPNGSFASNFGNAYYQVGLDWQIAGTGDFNGDGRDDILWRDNTGRVTNWLGQGAGGFTPNFANADGNAGLDWHIVGIGDFNHDGRDDILWRNDNGDLTDWLSTLNGGFASNFENAFYRIDPSWQAAGVGDFNGDGWDDILWRNDLGRVTNWLGQGNGGFTPNFAKADHNAGTEWQVASVGDFNLDGRDDILWRNGTSGEVTDWLAQAHGNFVSNFGNAYYQVDLNWQVQPNPAGLGTWDY